MAKACSGRDAAINCELSSSDQKRKSTVAAAHKARIEISINRTNQEKLTFEDVADFDAEQDLNRVHQYSKGSSWERSALACDVDRADCKSRNVTPEHTEALVDELAETRGDRSVKDHILEMGGPYRTEIKPQRYRPLLAHFRSAMNILRSSADRSAHGYARRCSTSAHQSRERTR